MEFSRLGFVGGALAAAITSGVRPESQLLGDDDQKSGRCLDTSTTPTGRTDGCRDIGRFGG